MPVLHQLEVYAVFSEQASPAARSALLDALRSTPARVTEHPNPDGSIRAFALVSDHDPEPSLQRLKAQLFDQTLRWLEFGLRGYGLFEQRREYKPWKRNRYLKLEALRDLATPEPEVRYHAPE